MNKFLNIILIFAIIAFCTNCKTSSRSIKPMESYLDIITDIDDSTINIPAQLDLKEIERSINEQLGDMLKNEGSLQELGGRELDIRIEKSEDIDLIASGKEISYRVPLKLNISKDMAITTIQAEGEIALNFKTNFEVAQDWTMGTHTEVVGFEWLRRPILKLGFVDLPIEKIATRILNKAKVSICETIDQQIQQNFSLKEQVEHAWETLKKPILVVPEQEIWLKLKPQRVTLAPLITSDDLISTTVGMVTKAALFIGEKPADNDVQKLPPFEWADNIAEDFNVHVAAEIPYEEAEKLVKAQLDGQTFQHNKYSATISDLKLYGQNEKLIVDTNLSGTFNGNVYLTAIPFLNKSNNTIEMKDLDYEVKTKNLIHKTATWMFKKGLTKRLNEELRFPLQGEIDKIKKTFDEKLTDFEVNENISMAATLDDLKIEKTSLTQKGIRVDFSSQGKLNVHIKGMQ